MLLLSLSYFIIYILIIILQKINSSYETQFLSVDVRSRLCYFKDLPTKENFMSQKQSTLR